MVETPEFRISDTPRGWDDKTPNESWNRSIPSVQVPNAVYEALQEISMSPKHEFGGKMAPVIREALEAYVLKTYEEDGAKSAASSAFLQMKEFRDVWAEERLANEMAEQLDIIEVSFDRWRIAGDTDRLVAQFEKVMYSLRLLTLEWQTFMKEKLKSNRSVQEAFDLVFKQGNQREREVAQVLHDIINE